MCIKKLFKTECSISPPEGFLGVACHASRQGVWCTAPGIYFNLHGNLLWNSDFSVLSGCSWQEMSFMNANDIWLEPTTQLFSLQRGRGFIRSVPASHVSFPAPHHRFWRRSKCLCRISLGSSNTWGFWDRNFPIHPKYISAEGYLPLPAGFSLQRQGEQSCWEGRGGSNQHGFVVPLCRKAWWQWAGLLEGSSPLPGQTNRHTHRRNPALAPHLCKGVVLLARGQK